MPDDLPSDDLAWRFLINFDGDALSVEAVLIAEMRAGTSDSTDDFGDTTGFWYDLIDANGTVLFRRITTSPMSAHAEISSEFGDFTRAPRNASSGHFEIVTPVITEATTLAIVGISPFDEDQGSPASTLASFDLGGLV